MDEKNVAKFALDCLTEKNTCTTLANQLPLVHVACIRFQYSGEHVPLVNR